MGSERRLEAVALVYKAAAGSMHFRGVLCLWTLRVTEGRWCLTETCVKEDVNGVWRGEAIVEH